MIVPPREPSGNPLYLRSIVRGVAPANADTVIKTIPADQALNIFPLFITTSLSGLHHIRNSRTIEMGRKQLTGHEKNLSIFQMVNES
jgi:hypothetical protein